MMDTYLTLQGNLVADPEMRSTASGAKVVNFRVASSGRRFDRQSGEFRDTDPLFMRVACWRSLGEHAMHSLRKGDSVIIMGRLIFRSYDDKQGVRRNVHELDAISVGPDLARCAADLRRPTRHSAEPSLISSDVADRHDTESPDTDRPDTDRPEAERPEWAAA